MIMLPAAPIVSFENRPVKPIAESHIARHSGHFGRNVRAMMEAPDVPAANNRFLLDLLDLLFTCFTRFYCLTRVATEICGHLIPMKSRITV
jgi:hypothetical protein